MPTGARTKGQASRHTPQPVRKKEQGKAAAEEEVAFVGPQCEHEDVVARQWGTVDPEALDQAATRQ